MATLTYVYADQTAVLGPLATYAEPHTYDLCAVHADRLSAPRGWATVRLVDEGGGLPGPDGSGLGALPQDGRNHEGPHGIQDDLCAVVDAVREGAPLRREAARARPSARSAQPAPGHSSGAGVASTIETARRGHLRILRDS